MIYHNTLLASVTSTFVILPRVTDVLNTDTLSIKNQSTNTDLSVNFVSAVYDSNNILTISFSLNTDTLEEGVFYEIELTKNVTNAVLWRGIMFVSDQVKQDYTINKNEFKENTSTNEYIILE